MSQTGKESDEVFAWDIRPEEFFVKSFEGDEPDDLAAAEESAEDSAEEGFAAAHAVSRWRAAGCLLKLKEQVDAAFPRRNKASDGMIGDDRHCRGGGTSDHCPNIPDGNVGVVTAYDITDDPANGCDVNSIVEAIRDSRDRRVKYIIWNRKIANSKSIDGAAPWEWRNYTGRNPHTKHMHLSVLPSKQLYDDRSEWRIRPLTS